MKNPNIPTNLTISDETGIDTLNTTRTYNGPIIDVHLHAYTNVPPGESAGWPYITETIAMMYIYPEVYADIGVLSWALPREAFYDALRTLINAGFGKRLLFGTDQMFWSGAIGLAVETFENVPFLTDEQKRDIFYNNAARLLELSEEEIARHHGR